MSESERCPVCGEEFDARVSGFEVVVDGENVSSCESTESSGTVLYLHLTDPEYGPGPPVPQ